MEYKEEIINAVWEKGIRVSGNDPKIYRKDECGAWIARNKHGSRDSQYGWEIDHISPGGSDAISNLRPLQWGNNLDKSDGRLKCNIVAEGTTNVRKR